MTIEEIERVLQTVAANQTQLTEAQIANEARLVKLDEIVKQIAEAHKSIVELIRLHEERLDGHDGALRTTDDKLSALINAQVGLEDRQAKIEESHQLLVQLIRIHDERIDGHDEALQNADGKLDAMIEQIKTLLERGNGAMKPRREAKKSAKKKAPKKSPRS